MKFRSWLRLVNTCIQPTGQCTKPQRGKVRKRKSLAVELLEERATPAAFTAGNIAVLDLAAVSTNTTGSILELSPSVANQANPVQTVGIASTGTNALRFSDSGTSGFLSDSNDGTLLTLAAYNSTNSAVADLATLTASNARAVATLDSGANFTLQTTYTDSTSGNQTRSATTLNNSNYFITDKGGLFTNGASSASLTTNILDARSFGGTVYVSSTKTALSTVASPTATTLSGLPGLATDAVIQDFYLIQSGSNGSTFDVLYTLDQNASNATINKFSLVGGSWVANGTFTVASNATGLIAENNGSGAYLYVLTTKQATNNSLVQLTDSTGWVNNSSATTGFTLTNSTTLYTDTASDTMKGIAFVPASAATTPTVASPTKANVGINSATLGGTVTSTGSPSPISYGVVYALTSTNSNPTIGGTGVTPVPGSGTPVFAPFTVSATGLQGTSNYSFAAYATNSAGTSYSSVGTFTTQSANPPSIDTPTDTSITATSATLGGTVESNGGATITKTGVVYALTSANSNPQIGGTGVTEVDTASPANGAFTISATSLSSGSGYTFEAFATNSSGTTYTAATSFTTLAAPTVNTPTFTNVTSSSATLGGNIASNGGATISKWGVVYALTSVNSNPQLGVPGVNELDASGTPSGPFTVSATGLSSLSSYTFAAFATNSIGTSYTAATAFTTANPNVITAWTFPTIASAPDNSPAPTYGTGTATTLGMTNTLTNGNGTGNTASDDVLSTSGSGNPNFTENLWRIRGTPNNGWALSAPQYSQGVELDTSTVGFSNIIFSFDWYSTTQGIRDLQVQYNTGSGWVNYQGPSPTGTFVATSNDFYNATLSPPSPTIYINLSGITAANNNPDLGIRLVSAYDSTGTLGNVYASAASTPGNIVPYNNTSGNWRFGNLTFSTGTTTSTKVTASPAGSQNLGKSVTFTATVTPASGTQFPSGTIAFFDGNSQIGTTQTVTEVGTTNVGTASITLSSLTAGIHGDITAQYTPAAGNGLIGGGSSMNLVVDDPTDNPISYVINAPQATGVDISPIVGQAFTGVVATFSDGLDTNPNDFAATITWGDGHTSNGVIAFTGTKNETNINSAIVAVRLFTVTGTNTYAAAGTDALSITITDASGNSATVTPNARVAYPPLVVTAGPVVNADPAIPLSSATVATFTDPGLVANLTALGISDPTTQFSASINWGDYSSATTGAITYNANTKTFSVLGSHTYSQAGPYSIAVAVTPLTVSVERIDSSDPNNLNEVGDEINNGITDSPSADFIDQYAIGAPNQAGSLYTFSLPTVATASGNEALTNSSYSVSEGELTLSTNNQYLVLGGYNDTVSLWAPQQTFSPASVINRVIGTVDGQGDINTTTALTDTYTGDNFRGVVSTNGTQFWTAGHSGDSSDFVHYAQLGASTSTTITGPSVPANINTVEIFNGQLYEGIRAVATGAPAGIYQIGSGLPTTVGQTQTLFIQVPQTNPLDVTDSTKPTSVIGFYLANLNDGNPTVNGVNVAYIADSEMGIARYDHLSTGWQFSYYINSTGSFLNSDYTVDSNGNVTPTSNFNSTTPIPSGNPNADPSKAGGVRELTGRIVNGQVQLFAVTGFGTGSQPNPGEKLIEVTDTGANAGFTTLATDTGASVFTGVAFTPTQTVTSKAQVNAALSLPTSLAGGSAGTLYNPSIAATGGTGNDTFTISNFSAGGTGLAAPTPSGNKVAFNSTPTAPGTVTFTVTATDTAGGTATQNYQLTIQAGATITGTVFLDANVNGSLDSGESTVAGATVYLDANNNGQLDSGEATATTGANGQYTFTNLGAGTYFVRLQAQNTLFTSPLSGTDIVTLAATGSQTANFGIVTFNPAVPIPLPTALYTPATPKTDANADVEAFVRGLYHSILNRDAEPTGLTYWVNTFNAVNTNPQALGLPTGTNAYLYVSQGIWTSQEHRWLEVGSYYQEFLGRSLNLNNATDVSARQYWTNQFLFNGETEADVIRGFLTSGEFLLNHRNDASLANTLNGALLAGTATTADLQTWTNELSALDTLRASVKNQSFASSNAYRASLTAQLSELDNETAKTGALFDIIHSQEYQLRAIDSFYIAFIHRTATSAEEQTWLAQHDSSGKSLDLGTIAELMLASQQYHNNATASEV